MRIRNRRVSAAWKALLALAAWAGILLQCGVFSGKADFSSLRYYTLLSNVLIAGYFSCAFIAAARNQPAPLPTFKGALIMGITVTGLVFHLMLSGSFFSMGSTEAVANQLLHTVTPLMSVLDWLLYDEKGRYGKTAPLRWTLLPNIYFILATVYGLASGDTFHNGSRFPYFFIDYDALGAGRVLAYVLGLNIAFIALGYAFVAVDRRMKPKVREKE